MPLVELEVPEDGTRGDGLADHDTVLVSSAQELGLASRTQHLVVSFQGIESSCNKQENPVLLLQLCCVSCCGTWLASGAFPSVGLHQNAARLLGFGVVNCCTSVALQVLHGTDHTQVASTAATPPEVPLP